MDKLNLLKVQEYRINKLQLEAVIKIAEINEKYFKKRSVIKKELKISPLINANKFKEMFNQL